MEFIKDKLKKIVHKNYKYIELILGKPISKNIFDSRISKHQFIKLLNYFKDKLKNYEAKTIISKNYEILNKRLNINDKFQQRCFEQTLFDSQLLEFETTHFMITFGEKKMISIENFDISQKYYNEVLKKIISFNIKNQFYLNFITNQNEQTKTTTYCIQIYITKKNGKQTDIISSLQVFISIINKILNLE